MRSPAFQLLSYSTVGQFYVREFTLLSNKHHRDGFSFFTLFLHIIKHMELSGANGKKILLFTSAGSQLIPRVDIASLENSFV